MKERADLPIVLGLVCSLVLLIGFSAIDFPLGEREVLSLTHKTSALGLKIFVFLGMASVATFFWTRALQDYLLDGGKISRGLFVHCFLVTGPVIILAAWAKPLFSADAFYYVLSARQLTIYGLSPFEVPPKDMLFDPVIAQIPRHWFEMTSPYGPLTLALFCVPSLFLTNPALFLHTKAIKLFWIVFYLGFAKVFLSYCQSPDRFARTMGLLVNPALLWFCLLDGHLDVILVFFLFLVALTMREKGPVANALALCAAACVKIVAIVCLPVCFFWWLRQSWQKALSFSAIFLFFYGSIYGALKGAEYRAVLRWTEAWPDLNYASLVTRILSLFDLSKSTIRMSSNLIFFLGIVFVCVLLWKGYFKTAPGLALGACLLALFLTRSYYQPWHALWFWPLLWLEARRASTFHVTLGLWSLTTILTFQFGLSFSAWPIGLGALFSFYLVAKDVRDS
jgi:hypothetical protein